MYLNTQSGWEIKILAFIAVLFSIVVSQSLLFPLILVFFLYLLLNPIQEWMVRIKIPRVIASALIVGALLGIISAGISFLVEPAANWIEHAPENFRVIEKKFLFIKKSLGKITEAAETAQDIGSMTEDNKITPTSETKSIGSSLFDLTSSAILLISTVLIFLFFLLIYFKTFIRHLEKIIYIQKDIQEENEFILHLKNEVSKYVLTFSTICAGFGVVMAIALWLLELPNAMLWGTMAMLLTFIPYLGHLIGIIIIFFVSLITFDSYIQILIPPITYFLLTVLEGQVVTPILLGERLNLNPLIVFFSMFLWGWLWGVGGVLISVPLLVTIKIILEHLPALSRYKLLLEK